jgi:hypothetical protein
VSDVLDLSKPAPDGHEFTVKLDPKESKLDRGVRLFKDVVLFVAALTFVVAIVVYLYDSIFKDGRTPSADDKRWAQSVLTAILAGLIGYMVKK